MNAISRGVFGRIRCMRAREGSGLQKLEPIAKLSGIKDAFDSSCKSIGGTALRAKVALAVEGKGERTDGVTRMF